MAQRKSLLEEIREQNSGASFNQQVVDTAKKSYTVPDIAPVQQQPTQQQGQQRTSLLQEIIDSDGMDGLNQDYAQKALDFDGGFGAIPSGYIKGDDGNVYMHDYSNNAEILRQRREQKNTGGVYKPEDMSFADQVIDRILGVDRTQVTGEKTDWGKLIKGIGVQGANRANATTWSGVNYVKDLGKSFLNLKPVKWLFGGIAEELHAIGTQTVNGIIDGLNLLPGVNIDYVGMDESVIDRLNADAQAGLTNATNKYADNANSSRAAQIINSFGVSTIAAVPMAIEAIALAPAMSANAGAATTAGLQYFSGLQNAKGLEAAGMIAKEGMTKLFKNPQFWTSYLDAAGGGYEDALADGMSDEDAKVYALVNGFFNAMIEIGGADETLGGIQNLPMRLQQQGGKNAVVEWFKDSVLGEGKEEVLQGIFERGTKSFFEDNVPVASLDPNDDRAIFNPITAGQEFLGGAVVGGLLGGGEAGISKAVNAGTNAAANAIVQRQIKKIQTAQETAEKYIRQVVSNMEIPEAQKKILIEDFIDSSTDAQAYVLGIQEAMKLGGEIGLTYEQAVENRTKYSRELTREQFQHAWEIGAVNEGRTVSEAKKAPRGLNVPEYDNIEEFSREFSSPEKVTEIFDQAADVDVNEFAAGFRAAYDMGQSGVNSTYLTEANVPALTEAQRTAAYQLGQTDAEVQAVNRDLKTASKQRSGNLQRVKGTVRGEGVTIADMRTVFNDRQNTAYRLLTKYAETTGVNIVLYNSQADSTTGLYPEAQGRFQWKDDSIYIDINSGLNSIKDVNSLGNYTMLRTFAHEFTHFIEKWNAAEYNEFRQFVFDTLESRGENVHDLIESMQARDTSGNMTYEQASREVVADAMMDILPDSNLVQQLASEHQNIFRRILQKLREFTARMKQYYREISSKAPREAQALQENGKYLDSIIKMFDNIAKGAVENYQRANGEEFIDQPGKPDNLPKRRSTSTVRENRTTEQEPQRKRVGMDFFRTGEYETGDETAPVLKDMVPRKAEPEKRRIGRDYFPANDFTSQAEEGPDLKSMVPKAAQKPVEAQEEEKVSDVPVNEEKPAEEAPEAQRAGEETRSLSSGEKKLLASYIDTIINRAAINGISLSDYYSATQGIDTKNLDHEQAVTIVNALRPVVEAIDDADITEFLNAIIETAGIDASAAAVTEESTAAEIIEAAEKDAVEEPVPPKAETEEAKQEIKSEIKKSVRFPVETSNDAALETALRSKELSLDNVTLPGNVNGFNKEQRAYIVKNLIEGFYDLNKDFYSGKSEYPGGSGSIKLDVPYDGKFTVNNDINYVLHVLKAMKATVTQDVEFNKTLMSILRTKQGKIGIAQSGGQHYVTNGYMLIPVSESAYNYAKENMEDGIDGMKVFELEEKNAKDLVTLDYSEVTTAPNEITFATGKKSSATVYAFEGQNGTAYFDKRIVTYLDGGTFYLGTNEKHIPIVKAIDADGNVIGYALPVKPGSSIENGTVKPSNLKAFKPVAKKTNAAKQKKSNQSAPAPNPGAVKKNNSKPPVVETTAKLEDFGEKIGGARKDWRSEGLYSRDLEDMNDRERTANVKKDNVWKKPDYRKLIAGGANRAILYARNEIRKSLNAKIAYRSTWDEQTVKLKQQKYVDTIREIQALTEKAETKADFENMITWLVRNGYLEMSTTVSTTEKWRSDPALFTSTYYQTLKHLIRNFDNLEKLADKSNFAVDKDSSIPAGFGISQNKGDNATWYITKGHWIVRDNFPTYEDALNYLREAQQRKTKKTRFVPEQLLAVHRKGPDYRGGKNVDGQAYIDTFGFKGGEYGNWMTQKDRQASLDYGYDALMDLSDALGIPPTDISFEGNLNIAFGARGQGLSGASAHYEPLRHVINLTKMKGAGSLAHEWFHALDDFIGGYKGELATARYYDLPSRTKEAVANLIRTMKYKDQSAEEADLSRQHNVERNERRITNFLNDWFKWADKVKNGTLTESETKYFKRVPTTEDVEKLDAIKSRLLNGEVPAIEDLSNLRKEITGHVIDKESRDAIRTTVMMLTPEARGTTITGRKQTDFYNGSQEFDKIHTKDGDYWSSTVEMAARSFSCYITDKTGKSNDYLSAHSDIFTSVTLDRNDNPVVVRAYPVGEERTAINQAFDNLVDAMKADGFLHTAEETEKPDIVQYSRRRITSDMTDEERYNVLKDKTISITAKTDTSKLAEYQSKNGVSLSPVPRLTSSQRKKLFQKIGNEFNVFKEYSNKDIELSFNYSASNLHESLLRQRKNYGDFAKLLSCFDDVVDSAVGIEVHNRNAQGYKPDPTLNNVYVLVSAFEDGSNVIPAKLEVKEFSDKPNTLYVSVALESIKKDEVIMQGNTENGVTQYTRSSEIRLADLLSNVNPKDESFTKYIPEQFFKANEEELTEESIRRQYALSDREVLSMAANDIDVEDLTPAEQDALRIFRERLDRLQEAQEQRADLGRQYKDQQFTKGGSHQEADRTRAAMSVLDTKIKSLENSLLSLENKDVLKTVLQKARRVVEQEEKKRGDENLKRYRERRNESAATRKYRDKVRTEVETLRKWLVNPSNKDMRAHVPAEIQKTVANFLESINLMSKTALRTSGLDTTKADEKYLKNMKKMRDAIKANVDSQGLYSGYADLPEDFIENFNALISKTEEHIKDNSGQFVVNEMSAAELKQLSQTLKTLKKYITTMNMFHNNAMFQHTDEAGEDTIQHLTPLGKSKKSGFLYKFLNFDYERPAVVLERFGKGGQSIYREFQEGQSIQAFLAKKIIEFAKKTYTGKEVKAWSEQTKTFELSDGETVTIPITHLMSLYCLNKRPQALTHIYGDGIRVANYKNGKNVEIDEGHLVTLKDVQKMIQELTPRQMEVADALQKYMSTETAIWGNYVSMARFDVEQFTEENYFPINSDGRYLSTTADESPDNAGLYAILNSSFTKELKENASNRIILYNIFDVFANHTASMTQYRSFALPVLDALKWFNYKNDDTSVRTKLSSAFGAPLDERAGSGAKGYAEQFVINLLKSYNGTAPQGGEYDKWFMGALHRFNRSAVAFNARVIIQQPTAIARAGLILSPAKLEKGLGMSAVQMQKLADEMEAHSGIAAWKALGFYDTNISRGLTELIKQNPTFGETVTEVGMKGAEGADRYTWAAMWYAAKDTVRRSDYKTEEEYFKAVTNLFEDVIYKTQVVDSVLTKSEFLRSKDFMARVLGSFMSEQMTTFTMLASAYNKFCDDTRRGKSVSEAWQKNGPLIMKTVTIYAISKALNAAVTAIIDAWRDDDDYATFMQKYLDAFKNNLVDEMVPFGLVPGISELWEGMKWLGDKTGFWDEHGLNLYGNGLSNGWAQYADYLKKAAEIFIDLGKGKSTNYTFYGGIYNLLRGAAGATGYPIATLWREVQDIWNNTVGHFNPRMKLKTYRVKDEAGIKHALQDGYLTEEQARDLLLEKGIAKDGNEAFFKVQEWATGEKKYDSLKEAVVAGSTADYLSAMDGLTDHGIKEKDANSTVKSFVRGLFTGEFSSDRDAEIAGNKKVTESEARRMLIDYAGLDADEAREAVDGWKFKQKYGFDYNDRKSAYMDGTITSAQLRSILMTNGGKSAEDANEIIQSYDFEKRYGWAWSERKEQYQKGKVTRYEMLNILQSYGDMTPEKAESTLEVWDWSKNVPGAENITDSAVEKYNTYCAMLNVDKGVFVQAWKGYNDTKADVDEKGESIPYSKTAKVMPQIAALPISAAEKTAIALCFWSQSTVNKYKLW